MASRRRQREEDVTSSGGMALWVRFTLSMTLALTVVMAVAGFLLNQAAGRVSEVVQEQSLVGTVRETARQFLGDIERQKLRAERELLFELEQQAAKDIAASKRQFGEESTVYKELGSYQTSTREALRNARTERERKLNALAQETYWRQVGENTTEFAGGAIKRAEVEFGPEKQRGFVYHYQTRAEQPPFVMLVPGTAHTGGDSLFGLIVAMTLAVIVVGAVVSLWVSNQVTQPIQQLVEDVRQISTGDLDHRVHSRGSGEVASLARALDRMTKSLGEARENEVELQVRQREVEVAGEVREQLLPQVTPKLPGYDLGSLHMSAPTMGGDFHDFLEIGPAAKDGVGLLVCEVSGRGLPGALVGATARSYLRAKLVGGGDLKEALQDANRQLARDVRRGMAVTSLYALVDPANAIATVACAGHKIPLIRYTAADKKVRLIHPEGIALGFDKGPVFDRALSVQQVPIEPGDRLVLVNSGAVSVTNEAGEELGEKALYAHIMRLGALPTEAFLAKLKTALENYAGESGLPRDISIVTVARA
jgi:serine phosphatase RsbU (regulator of sigma subunit)